MEVHSQVHSFSEQSLVVVINKHKYGQMVTRALDALQACT